MPVAAKKIQNSNGKAVYLQTQKWPWCL